MSPMTSHNPTTADTVDRPSGELDIGSTKVPGIAKNFMSPKPFIQLANELLDWLRKRGAQTGTPR